MLKEKLETQDIWMSTKRIETLVDGIFAIAMTLLVLNIDVPQIVGPISNAVIWQGLMSMEHQFWTYALSFILLAVFWRINHQQFYWIKKADNTMVWINVLWLMFVALVPFSTNLISDYGNYQIPMIFFHLNMFTIGILYSLNWYYVARRNFLDERIDLERIEAAKRVNLVFPVVALFAIALTFITPSWSPLAYFLIIFMKRIF